MTNVKRKFLTSLCCFLLIFTFAFAYPLGIFASSGTSLAFSEYDGDFDYLTVSLEPKTQNTSVSASRLDTSELRSLKLYPGGVPFGVKFLTEGILVVGFCDVDNGAKKENPSAAAGLKIGDRIVAINGKTPISSAELNELADKSGGKPITVEYVRFGNRYTCKLTPVYSKSEGCYKTGLYVKDNGAGIGTVTYIVPDSLAFGGLGHGICEGESGRLMPISRGSVLDVTINGVVKGQVGEPGEVKGYFSSSKTGSLLKNSSCGVFGVFATLPKSLPSEPLSLALRDELHEGKAYIYCTLDESGPKKYEIEISNINREEKDGKCFTVKVTDKRLLDVTGGIVQGMSGSPIIQDGKLAGAVTHVLINDPTSGYGIFIENMLANQ